MPRPNAKNVMTSAAARQRPMRSCCLRTVRRATSAGDSSIVEPRRGPVSRIGGGRSSVAADSSGQGSSRCSTSSGSTGLVAIASAASAQSASACGTASTDGSAGAASASALGGTLASSASWVVNLSASAIRLANSCSGVRWTGGGGGNDDGGENGGDDGDDENDGGSSNRGSSGSDSRSGSGFAGAIGAEKAAA